MLKTDFSGNGNAVYVAVPLDSIKAEKQPDLLKKGHLASTNGWDGSAS